MADADELESLRGQVRGLTRKLQAWEGIGKEAGTLIQYDHTGTPTGWQVDDAPATPTPQSAANQQGQAQALSEQAIQQLIAKQGFVTPAQIQETLNKAMQQVYMANRGDMILFRNIDQIRAEDKFKDLGKYDSPLSKKTAEVLTRMGWGKPLTDKVKAWEEWQYADPNAIRQAAQIARAEVWEDSQAAQAASASGQAAQAGAGLSVQPQGQGGASSAPTPDVTKMSDEEFDAKLKSDLSANLDAIGIK